MKQINVYEAGKDPLPVAGASVAVIDKRTTFGLFEEHHQVVGNAVLVTDDERAEYGMKDVVFHLDDGTEVLNNSMWMYEHEYLPIISDITFPFQDWDQYQIALEQGWCEQHSIDVSEDWFDAHDGTKLRWFYTFVTCSGINHKVTWVEMKNPKNRIRFQDWEPINDDSTTEGKT